MSAPIQHRAPADHESKGLEVALKEKALVLGSTSAKGVGDVDTKPRDANNLLIQPLEKMNIGEQTMQMIILQLMNQQKQNYKRRRMRQHLMFFSSRCHHQRSHHMIHLQELVVQSGIRSWLTNSYMF